jgi:acyl carrier protein
MTPATADEQVDLIRKWLLERNTGLGDIDLDLDLIESRALSSLAFVNFVLYLEEITGKEIDIAAQPATAFRTLRSIRDNFVAAARSTARDAARDAESESPR